MVKKVDNINKNKYEQKQNHKTYIIVGIAAVLVMASIWFLGAGGGGSSTALAGPAPSGSNCPENVAYLQTGVDKYREVTGQIPTELTQLLEETDGKTYVEALPECPSGNIYIISPEGVVGETAPK